MILFFISFLLVFISSYFLTAIIAPKKSILGVIYLFLIAFAQIVLTFEILSLFSAITQTWVLSGNVFFFALSGYLWNKNQRQIWSLDFKDFKNRFVNSMKLDKSLIWLCFGFCFFIIVTLFLCLIMPVNSPDGLAYHVARSLFWIFQGNLNHFDTPDVRNLCLPINSEILYSWVLLFAKKDVFFGFFSFVGYLLSIISIYNILGLLKFCVRKRLWVIFILSSFPSILVQASSVETDIIIAGLILSSVFLFWYALKYDKKIPVYMASLAYALAIGTKTPAIIMIPAVGLFFAVLCFYYKKYRPMALFLGCGILNFLIFSSYNYILNYIQFSDFMSAQSFIVINKNYYGIKGAISNFIKHLFLFTDFTGFKWQVYLDPYLQVYKNSILSFLNVSNLPDSLYTSSVLVNGFLSEQFMGAGTLGLFVYLPCSVIAVFKSVFKPNSRKTIIALFGAIFFINLFVLSYVVNYSSFDVRYLVAFIVLSSPILIYSYGIRFKFLRNVIIFFALFSFFLIGTNIRPRPFFKIINVLKKHPSIEYLRYISTCKNFEENPLYSNPVCLLREKIKKDLNPNSRILIFLNESGGVYSVKMLEFEGYKIDLKTMEDSEAIDFAKYDAVVLVDNSQTSSLIKYYKNKTNEYVLKGNELVIIKKNNVPCSYAFNYKLLNPESYPPCFIKCTMSSDFLSKKHFELLSAIEYFDAKNKSVVHYYIYKNQKLPLGFKK